MKNKLICIAAVLIGLNVEYLGIYVDTHFAGVIVGLCIFLIYLSLDMLKNKINWLILAGVEAVLLLSYGAKAQLFATFVLITFSVHIIQSKNRIEETYLFLQKISFAILIYDVLQKHSEFVFNAVNVMSGATTKVLTFGTPMGDSVSCFAHFWIVAVCCAVFLFKQGEIKKSGLFILSVLIGYVAYVNIFAIVLEKNSRLGINLIWIAAAISIAGVAAVFRTNENTIECFVFDKGSVKEWACIAVFAVLLVPVVLNPIKKTSENDKNVTLVNNGYLVDFSGTIDDEDVLGFGAAPVLFATLKDYIKAGGFSVSIVDTIDDVLWDSTDLVLFANYTEVANDKQKETIENYLNAGGAMAVFSDHTNMENIMTGSNSLLESTGIRINDDISDNVLHYDGKIWNNSMKTFSNICFDFEEEPRNIQIFGGASLSIKADVIPLVVGKYALSDPADVTNVGAGGLLGNRKFDRGEPVGDTCLAAIDYVGKGRVIVFGDTSSVQNTALFTSGETFARLFHWLTESAYSFDASILKLVAGVGILILCALFIFGKVNSQKPMLISLALLLTIFAVNGLNHANYSKGVISKMDLKQCIAIDESLGENFDVGFNTQYTAIGTAYSFYRYGLVPMFTDNEEIMLKSGAVAVIAPNKAMSSIKQKKLTEYMNNGGNVILALGYDREKNIGNLLHEVGLSMDSTNMGPVPWKNVNLPETMDEEIPEFKEAYPIFCDANVDAAKLYTFSDLDFVVSVTVGNGTCTLLSDSRFFVNDNVEGEFSGKKGNVNLVGRMVSEVVLNEK